MKLRGGPNICGVTIGVLFEELTELYAARLEGRPIAVRYHLTVQFTLR